jgi:hypothetical protein
MGLFNKLFTRRASPETEQPKAIIRKAPRKSQGAYKAATSGIKIWDRFFAVIEGVEAKLQPRDDDNHVIEGTGYPMTDIGIPPRPLLDCRPAASDLVRFCWIIGIVPSVQPNVHSCALRGS